MVSMHVGGVVLIAFGIACAVLAYFERSSHRDRGATPSTLSGIYHAARRRSLWTSTLEWALAIASILLCVLGLKLL